MIDSNPWELGIMWLDACILHCLRTDWLALVAADGNILTI